MSQTTIPTDAVRPGLGRRMLRHLAWAAVIYPSLFLVTAILAAAACYVWPWLLDPVSP